MAGVTAPAVSVAVTAQSVSVAVVVAAVSQQAVRLLATSYLQLKPDPPLHEYSAGFSMEDVAARFEELSDFNDSEYPDDVDSGEERSMQPPVARL